MNNYRFEAATKDGTYWGQTDLILIVAIKKIVDLIQGADEAQTVECRVAKENPDGSTKTVIRLKKVDGEWQWQP